MKVKYMTTSTPALIIDVKRMHQNIKQMQKIADMNAVKLRPHCKTHKSIELAKLQISAGAKGITVAKLGEAELMADAGIKDILIANIIVGDGKLARLTSLRKKCDSLATCVDSAEASEMLNSAFENSQMTGDVFIEINSGLNRCGLSDIYEIISLAKRISGLRHLKLRGILTHGGHAYNASSTEQIMEIGKQESISMISIADEMKKAGIAVDEISVGSTPTSFWCSRVKGISEMRPGNYIFKDMTQVSLRVAYIDECALSVLATVISTPAEGRAVIDAGHKALGLDRCPPFSKYSASYGHIIGKNASIVRLSEEHGVIEYSDESFHIGEILRIIPNHACAVVNLFDNYYLEKEGVIRGKLAIDARGKST